MIKFIIRDVNRFSRAVRKPLIRSLVFLDLKKLAQVQDETTFFKAITQIRLRNGTYKTTKPNRFADVDRELVEVLQTGREYQIHDVAVSDGITSVNLLQTLNANGITAQILSTDKFARIYFQKRWYGGVYSDENGEVLHLDFLNLQANRNTSWRFPLSKLLGFCLPEQVGPVNGAKEILILNPRTVEAIDAGQLEFEYFDIFEPQEGKTRFDIVRCMNLLNLGVFPEEAIQTALRNLIPSLKEEGILVIGRSNEKTLVNHASIFQRQGEKLALIKDVNAGSELKPLIKKLGFF